MRNFILFSLIAFVLFAGAGCTAEKFSSPEPLKNTPAAPTADEAAPQNTTPPDLAVPPKTETSAPAQTPVTKEFSITAKQWQFIPKAVTVNKGDRVILNITSIDVTHGFNLSAFGIEENLEPGKTTTVEFTADKEGSFTFYCSVFCGAGHSGMNGTLIVQ